VRRSVESRISGHTRVERFVVDCLQHTLAQHDS
jgi:hypothetical protein